MRFKDKVAIVTGSGRGIGNVIAMKFAGEGAAVTIADINSESIDAAVREITAGGGRAIGVKADVSTPEGAQKIVEETVKAFGTVHVLVNNAGTVRDGLIKNMSMDDWDTVVDVCLKGSFLCSKYATPHMVAQKYGKIINISSRAYLGNPGQANYSSAKAGILGLTRAMSKEFGRYFINVNAVAPGLIETELVKSHPKYDMIIERHLKESPIPRVGSQEDVANAVLFLASEESSYISGDVLHVSGGRFG